MDNKNKSLATALRANLLRRKKKDGVFESKESSTNKKQDEKSSHFDVKQFEKPSEK